VRGRKNRWLAHAGRPASLQFAAVLDYAGSRAPSITTAAPVTWRINRKTGRCVSESVPEAAAIPDSRVTRSSHVDRHRCRRASRDHPIAAVTAVAVMPVAAATPSLVTAPSHVLTPSASAGSLRTAASAPAFAIASA
jgi:hypothetical protein